MRSGTLDLPVAAVLALVAAAEAAERALVQAVTLAWHQSAAEASGLGQQHAAAILREGGRSRIMGWRHCLTCAFARSPGHVDGAFGCLHVFCKALSAF
eukprot:COSAG01_NODE_6081_length_3863_cov_56.781615_2_plen_98_part_00